MATRPKATGSPLPPRRIDRVTTPLKQFLHIEATSGLLLLLAAALALVLANSGLAADYRALVDTKVTLSAGPLVLDYPLWYWVNDGLMTLFFFVVGLEIKRELTTGELADPRKAALPVIAAIGGAVVPAVLFVVVLGEAAGGRGWAVPMATDIAFVVGALAVFGSRVPRGLSIFVLTLAIADDLLAVCIIAIFYSEGIAPTWLAGAAGGFAVIAVMNVLQVRSIGAYVVVGAIIWLCTLKSGVHPTIAGVMLGLLTPATAWLGRRHAATAVAAWADRLRDTETPSDLAAHNDAVTVSRESRSPLERLETALHPWVAYLILPIFVFVNAGVTLGDATATHGVGLAIAVGLLVGKPVGIGIIAFISIRLGWARMITGVSWPLLLSAGVLCGVGFTMSLFIASLGLEGTLLENAKAGILYGSGAALVVGMALFAVFLRRPSPSDEAPVDEPAPAAVDGTS